MSKPAMHRPGRLWPGLDTGPDTCLDTGLYNPAVNPPAEPWRDPRSAPPERPLTPSPTAPSDAGAPPPVDHYENFPVGSVLMPRRLRPAVFAIYHFARHADDIADEGDAPTARRLAQLAALHRQLDTAAAATTTTATTTTGATATGAPAAAAAVALEPVVRRLIEPVRHHRLQWRHFHALLDAFEQDLVVRRYPDAAAVQHYCDRSANPVGRLVLELFDVATPANLVASDAICSALQRINFLQDIAIDRRKDRIYLPLQTLAREGLDADAWGLQIDQGRLDAPARAVVAHECDRARNQLLAGRPLLAAVPLRLRWELRAIIAGGLRVLERIAALDHDPVATRPALGWRDAPALLRLALTTDRLSPRSPAR